MTPDNERGKGRVRLENGLMARQDARLQLRAIRENWPQVKRWNTDGTREELEDAAADRHLTLKEKIELAVHAMADDECLSIQEIAVKAGIAMEGQNQKDDLATDDTKQPAIQVNVQVNGLTANQRDREIASLLDAARARAITCTARDTDGDGVNAPTRDDAGQVADAGT